ncbi:MAG: BNR repeat-containing protein [Actinophytocola sp.]|uniref:BNR repeat-containing protein n=1 Tax=Actinophytocola sp. TaxID=1872138 RepID=UPI003D6AA35C
MAAVELDLLPGKLDNTWGYNGVPFSQDNVLTVNSPTGTVQYAVWWNNARHPIIGQRTYPGGDWVTFDLAAVSGNPLVSPVALDGHNTINVAVDTDGKLHVAANMHTNPMRYVRSVNPHDITSWTSTNKPGGSFTSLTYPQFIRLAGGQLHISYREGTSGNGDNYLQKWNPGSGAWDSAVKITDGKSSSENPYLHRIAVGTDDSIHMAIVWRGSGNGNTNNDLCHIRSLDGGVSWQSQAGAALTLPITHTTAPKVLDTAATGSGLLNTCGIDVDTSGVPHIATHIWTTDGSASRILYSYWDGAAWVNERLMSWTYKMPLDVSVVNAEVARPVIFCTSAGRTFVLYRMNRDGLRGTVRIREVTPNTSRLDASIADLETYAWEPSYDTRAVRDRGELHILLTPCRTPDPAIPEYDDQDWTQQPGGILTVDVNQLDSILAGTAALPFEWADTAAPPSTIPPPVGIPVVETSVRWFGCDLITGAVVVELPDLTGTVSRVLGSYTSSGLRLPIPRSGPGTVGDKVFSVTEPGRSLLVAEVNGIPTWGGIVLVRKGGTDATLELGCVSLEGYLARRFVGDHSWTQQDEASVIAAGLLADANVEGIGITIDAPATGKKRDRHYFAKDDATVYQRLRELMGVIDGPEWTIDLDWATTAKTSVVKLGRVRKRIGTVSTAKFQSTARDESRYTYEEDYSEGRGANHVIATSSGEGEDRPQSDPAVDIQPQFPRWEHRFSPSSSIIKKETLDEHALAELGRRRLGARTWQIEARWDVTPRLNVDWRLGDDVEWVLRGHRHPAGVTGTGRVIGWELDVATGAARPLLLNPADLNTE